MRELSAVDREILAKLQGDFPICERPYAEAAEQLGISESAVKASLRTVFQKLGVHTRSQLVRVALDRFREEL